MKHLLGISIFILFFISSNLLAQDCSHTVIMKEGALLEYTSFNRKNKKDSRSTHKIISVSTEGNTTIAKSKMIVYDNKDKEIVSSGADFRCENGVYIADMKGMFKGEQFSSMKDMEVKFDGEELRYPSTLNVGDELNNGSVNADVEADGIGVLMSISVNISDRKVDGKETITTDAGTFECFIISYTFESKVMMINIKGTSKEWYSPKVGVVRTESYMRNGKYSGKTELTKFEQ